MWLCLWIVAIYNGLQHFLQVFLNIVPLIAVSTEVSLAKKSDSVSLKYYFPELEIVTEPEELDTKSSKSENDTMKEYEVGYLRFS